MIIRSLKRIRRPFRQENGVLTRDISPFDDYVKSNQAGGFRCSILFSEISAVTLLGQLGVKDKQ